MGKVVDDDVESFSPSTAGILEDLSIQIQIIKYLASKQPQGPPNIMLLATPKSLRLIMRGSFRIRGSRVLPFPGLIGLLFLGLIFSVTLSVL